MTEPIVPLFFPCPMCHEEVPLQVLELGSKEADEVCLLCEKDNICHPCSRKLHSHNQSEEVK